MLQPPIACGKHIITVSDGVRQGRGGGGDGATASPPQLAGSSATTAVFGCLPRMDDPAGGRESAAPRPPGAGQRILSAQTDMWPGTAAPPGDVTLRLVGAKPPLGVQCR